MIIKMISFGWPSWYKQTLIKVPVYKRMYSNCNINKSFTILCLFERGNDMILIFFEAIKLLRNAALSKTATASSVLDDDHSTWGAHYATDGQKAAVAIHSFHSSYQTSPWFMITLDGPYTIQYVRVFNRRDCFGKWNLISFA